MPTLTDLSTLSILPLTCIAYSDRLGHALNTAFDLYAYSDRLGHALSTAFDLYAYSDRLGHALNTAFDLYCLL